MAIVGTITVAAAGTRVQSPKNGTVKAVMFKARSTNVGAIYVGDSSVSSSSGIELVPGESTHLNFNGYEQLQSWYADAANSNDKVDFVGDNT